MIVKSNFREPFTLRGVDGEIDVLYGINDDPVEIGFDLLNLPFDNDLVVGFPFLKASIIYPEDYYKAFFGWIQMVKVQDYETEEESVTPDIMPMNRELDYPFSFFGHLPTFFDAPGPNPPRKNESWIASTFLVFVSDVARTKDISALKGFEWGYVLNEGDIEVQEIKPISENLWNVNSDYLSRMFPSWNFNKNFRKNKPENPDF